MSKALPMGSPDAALPEHLDVAIIGGGIMGLSTAYQLTQTRGLGKTGGRRGPKVAVIERSYLVAGASGRNGGGVRMQWADAGNVALMMESIEMCRGLAQQLGINLWFRQGGYLFVARTEEAERRLVRNAELHKQVGAPTRLLTASEARELAPVLDVSGIRLATHNPEDGVVFPWPFVWGYAAQAMKRGVIVRTHTAVDAVEPGADGFALRLSTGERITADTVVNATGAWSPWLNQALGLNFGNRPHRHEILSSEPLKPFLDPLVVDLANGLYCSQSTRGELVTGMTVPDEEGPLDEHGLPPVRMGSSRRFLASIGEALVRLMPIAAGIRVLRQWAGPYDVSPDGDGIAGPSPGLPRFIQLCGFTGHGFMMAPAVGRLLARFIADGERHPMLDRWDPGRFAAGTSRPREDMIIG
ncbi:MAG: FAD-binding oxidoreductase [Myxococcota bacterium]